MVNPKCIEKAPAAEVKAQLERENGKGRQIGIMSGVHLVYTFCQSVHL